MSAYRRFILFFCLIATIGCNNGNQEDETDTDTQNACSDCLPAEGLPQLGSVDILEFPNNATSECEGVCIGTIDGPGECWFPREPEKTCDKKLKGIQTEVMNPALKDEPYCLMNGSSKNRDPEAMGKCEVPEEGQTTPWCSDCVCDKNHCAGKGDPFKPKQSRVYVPKDGPTKDELFVFLGGTGGNCSIHKWIGTTAATAGYRSVCLAYINDPASGTYCTARSMGNPDATCAYDFRMENITGSDLSEQLIVGPNNSIEMRLRKLIQYLAVQAPGAGFDQYLAGDDIQWDKLIVAGFSQGGGNAGILSMKYALSRSIFFSKGWSPIYDVDESLICTADQECVDEGWDYCSTFDSGEDEGVCIQTYLSSYTYDTRLTPPDRSYLLIHEKEGAIKYSLKGAAAWGMDECGELVTVDGQTDGDYGCSHILGTQAEPSSASGGDHDGGYHGSMGSDNSMAKDDTGLPVNQRAMMYMLLAE